MPPPAPPADVAHPGGTPAAGAGKSAVTGSLPRPPSEEEKDRAREESAALSALTLQLKLMEADNKYLADAVERKDAVLERLTDGLKEVQHVQDDLVATNEELAQELDVTRRALEEAARELWEVNYYVCSYDYIMLCYIVLIYYMFMALALTGWSRSLKKEMP